MGGAKTRCVCEPDQTLFSATTNKNGKKRSGHARLQELNYVGMFHFTQEFNFLCRIFLPNIVFRLGLSLLGRRSGVIFYRHNESRSSLISASDSHRNRFSSFTGISSIFFRVYCARLSLMLRCSAIQVFTEPHASYVSRARIAEMTYKIKMVSIVRGRCVHSESPNSPTFTDKEAM